MEDLATAREQIYELINYKKWDELQELWLEVMESVPQPITFHQPLVTRLIRKKHFDWLESLYGSLLEELLTRKLAESAFELIRLILRGKPDAAFVIGPLGRALRLIHADRPAERLENYLTISGLTQPSANIPAAIARFEEFLGAARGQVFRHSRWGLGIVVQLDAEGGKVRMDFPGKPGQNFTLDGVREFLQAIPNDHFVSEMVRDREELLRRMKDDPAEAVKFALRSFSGTLKVGELKKIVLEGLLDEAGWKDWWAAARDAVKLDPWIDMTGQGAHAELRLRSEPRSFTDEVLENLRKAADIVALRNALRDLRRHADDAPITPDQAQEIRMILQNRLASIPPSQSADRLALGYLWEEFQELLAGQLDSGQWDEAQCLGMASSPAEIAGLVLGLPLFEYQVRACDGVRKLLSEKWAATMAALIPHASTRLIAWIERGLVAAGETEARIHALEDLIHEPERNPEAFLWILRQLLDGTLEHVADGIPRALLMTELLDLLEQQHTLQHAGGNDAPAAKALASRLRSFLGESNHLYLRKVAKECSIEEARKLLSRINLHNAIPDLFKDGCEAVLISAHPDLKKQTRAEAEEENRKPSFHYTTTASLEAQRSRLSHILSVEIPENSKQIGIARDHGDLRENAEYHAAKERQKLLHQQAQELNDLISRARVVEPEHIKTDSIVFGTRFAVRDLDTAAERTYTLLGIWEAKPEQGILSYLTPLGGAFLNVRPGQIVEVSLDNQNVRYEILSIERAF